MNVSLDMANVADRIHVAARTYKGAKFCPCRSRNWRIFYSNTCVRDSRVRSIYLCSRTCHVTWWIPVSENCLVANVICTCTYVRVTWICFSIARSQNRNFSSYQRSNEKLKTHMRALIIFITIRESATENDKFFPSTFALFIRILYVFKFHDTLVLLK